MRQDERESFIWKGDEYQVLPEVYRKTLSDIEQALSAGDLDRAEAGLHTLSNYRPRLLKLDLLEAICQYKRTGKPGVFFEKLKDRWSMFSEAEDLGKVLNTCADLLREKKNALDEARYRFLVGDEDVRSGYYKELGQRISGREDGLGSERGVYFQCYVVADILSTFLQAAYIKKTYPGQPFPEERPGVKNYDNMGYLVQELGNGKAAPFLVMDEWEISRLAVRNLRALGKTVFSVAPSGNGKFRLRDAEGKILLSAKNIVKVLKYVRSLSGLVYVLATAPLMQQLSSVHGLAKVFQPMIGQYAPVYGRNLMLAWYGDYLSYISNIYLEDCHELFSRKPSCRFSIVIPVRNSAETLRHTLRTCLEQDYGGSYEILISDNSTGGNRAVYDFCQEILDPRVVYQKTPRDLYLPRSFEYAFLHASGEYVLSLGADDGLLPWALRELEEVIARYPEEEVIQWENGGYAWPGFNGKQENQFFVRMRYKEHQYTYVTTKEYLGRAVESPNAMFGLPLLYINSCFRRSYMKKLLKSTGRLWDGMCQDIYIGIVNACIYPRILNYVWPLSIAGMSTGSMGTVSNAPKKTDKALDEFIQSSMRDLNLGGYCKTWEEWRLPENGTDVCTLYACLLRAISLGILEKEFLGCLHVVEVFRQIADRMDSKDIRYDRKMQEMRFIAKDYGEEFLEWFDKYIFEPRMTPQEYPEADLRDTESPQKQEEAVQEERLRPVREYAEEAVGDQGGFTLDASKFGVRNIYDAVQLFVRHMKEEKDNNASAS
ncbi:MAG: glycosyltransferase family 2 protein [Selenomonadaceae bacterium]|nr:glycosyltransferase family 2 protein [Selenomonadaceae bacterium]